MTTLKLVLFDCDGTLVDSQHAIVHAMAVAWAEHGFGAPDPTAVRRLVGLPLAQAIGLLRPELDEAGMEAVAASYKRAFAAQRREGEALEPLFPGVLEALAALEAAGALIGVATGKSRRGLDAVLKGHGLTGRFVTLQTSDVGPGKPHPDMVFRALAETGASAAATVVVGDTTFDMQMAKNAKVGAIGVTWGYHDPEELTAAGAHHLVTHGTQVAPAALSLLEERMRERATAP